MTADGRLKNVEDSLLEKLERVCSLCEEGTVMGDLSRYVIGRHKTKTHDSILTTVDVFLREAKSLMSTLEVVIDQGLSQVHSDR